MGGCETNESSVILRLYNLPSSPRTLNFIHMHFLHKLLTLLSLKMTKPPIVFFSPIPTTLHSIYTRFHDTLLSPSHLVCLGPSISLTYTFFKNSFSQYDHIISKYFFLSIPLHHTSLHLHKFPSHIFHLHFHCSHSPILFRHMLLSDNSFPQHKLSNVVPYSMSKSMIHMSMLAGENCPFNFSLSPWTH